MKKLGIGLGILIIILGLAILVVPSFLNWNEYKAQIEQTATGFSGRDVEIKGDVSLSLLPSSTLSVKDVTVANVAGGRAEYMLSLKSLDVKVSFLSLVSSLFGGKVKVEKFILVDPVVALEMLENGRGNWELSDDSAAPSEESTSSADVSFDKFQVVNGQVGFEDLTTGRQELLRKINASVKAESVNGPFTISGDARYQGLDAQMDLNMGKNRPGKKVPVSLTLATQNGRIKAAVLGGVIVSGKDSFFGGKVNMTVRDAGDLFNVVDRLNGRLDSPVVKTSQAVALETVLELRVGQIAARDLNIRVGESRGQGGLEIGFGEKLRVEGDLSINKINLDHWVEIAAQQQKTSAPPVVPRAAGGEAESETDNLLARLDGALTLKLGALQYNEKVASQIALEAVADKGQIDITTIQARMPGGSTLAFKGKVFQEAEQPVMTGGVVLKSSNLRGLLNWVDVDVEDIPSGQLAQFSYKSSVKLTGDLLQLYGIEGMLDTMTFAGGVSHALQERPSYGVRLELRNFNLDSYFADIAPDPEEKTLKERLAALAGFDANYDIQATDMTWRGIKMQSGRLAGVLQGGKLTAETIRVTDFAGVDLSASGQGGSFADNPQLTLKIEAAAKSLSLLQRGLKLDHGFDYRRLGPAMLAGTISSGLKKMDVDVRATLGAKSVSVKGEIRSPTLKQFPEVGSADLEVAGRADSLAKLIEQFDLPIMAPVAGADHPVEVKGRIKGTPELIDADGRLNVASGEIAVKGRRKGTGEAASLDVFVDIKAPEMRRFARGLGLDFNPAREKLGPVALKMKVIGSGSQYTLGNIAGDVGSLKINGDGKLNLAADKPYVDLNLKAGEILLSDFLRESPGGMTPASSGAGEKNFGQWSREPLDLSLLRVFNGRARISAASLRYDGYFFQNPSFETVLKDGVLSVQNFTGRLFGGDFALSGRVEGTDTPKVEVRLSLKGAALSQATKAMAGVTPVTGLVDFTGNFSAAGASQYDMMSALIGEGKVVAGSGLIHGIDIPALSARLSEQLSKMNSESAFVRLLDTTLGGGTTSYKGGESALVAREGRISFSPLALDMDGAKSQMNLDLNLVAWDMRSTGRISLVKHPEAPPLAVNIAGNISDPKIDFETTPLLRYVSAKIASEKLQQLVGTEGGLEGIFGNKPEQGTPGTDGAAPRTPDLSPQTPESDPKKDFGKRLLEKLFDREKQDGAPPDNPKADNPER